MSRFLLVVVLVACGSKSGSGPASGPAGESVLARVPKVDSAAVTVVPPEGTRVPLLVFVEENGKTSIAAGPRPWAELASFQPSSKDLYAVDAKQIWAMVREYLALERAPREIVEHLQQRGSDDIALDLALEDPTPPATAVQDDPPPPEEEDKPDDGSDESGGTGTAMALEEGKMGKKDSDRAEGAYKMRKDPELDRELDRERAMPGPRGRNGGGAFASLTGVDMKLPYPERQSTVAAAIEDSKFPIPNQRAVIAARPKAKATAVIDVITETEGSLLVAHGTQVRLLRFLFGPGVGHRMNTDRWLEVRVTANEVLVEAVPDKPITIAWTSPQPAELAKAFTALRTKYPKAMMTDVLVGPDVDAQRLVDVLAALDAAGARAIALGTTPAPDNSQSKLRGQRIVRFASGQPNIQGGLDKAEVRRVVGKTDAKLRACYETELVAKPTLAGTVVASFLIDVKGKVHEATATGVDPAVASCIAGIIKTLQFPASGDKTKTQVNLPFSMR